MKSQSFQNEMLNRLNVSDKRNKNNLDQVNKNLRYSFISGDIQTVNDLMRISSKKADYKDYVIDIDFKYGQKNKVVPKFITSDKNTSIIIVNLSIDDVVVDITDCRVSVNIEDSEGSVFTTTCKVEDSVNGSLIFKVPEKCKVEKGIHKYELVVQYDNKELATPICEYEVIQGIGQGQSLASPYSILTHNNEPILTHEEENILFRKDDLGWSKI